MPLYEYQCDVCGHRFEVIQKFSDPLADICPKCGSPVRKLISSPAFQFKGSGFYITDYAKKDYTDATKADTDTKDSKETKDAQDSKDSKDRKETKESKETPVSKETKDSKSEKTSTSDKSTSSSSSTDSTSTSSSASPSSSPKKDS
jgi:putative FmdB family regulatory protein